MYVFMLIILTASITYVDYFEQIFAMLVSALRVLICCFSFQRDTTGLSAENTELRLRLQAMEQQAQLHDGKHDLTLVPYAGMLLLRFCCYIRCRPIRTVIYNPTGRYTGIL